jgi:hypothetical protein
VVQATIGFGLAPTFDQFNAFIIRFFEVFDEEWWTIMPLI